MRKRIFWYTSVGLIVTLCLFAWLWAGVFSVRFEQQTRDSLKHIRVTVIDADGEVVYDNYRMDLGNHADRPEVADALQFGTGESERYSDTLGEKTYYYAFRLNDGAVLRLAFTAGSITRLARDYIPAAAICLAAVLVLSLLLARRLTRSIVSPINDIDLDNADSLPYDELAPLAQRIAAQKREIESQLAALRNRADTIRAIIENMKEGMILVGGNGDVLACNKSACAIFGERDLSGRDFIHICRNIEFMDKARAVLSGKHSQMDMQADGRTYAVYFNPVADNGAIVLFLDVTDKYAAERQRKEFTANVSHELKTPLTTISALSEMIQSGMALPRDISAFAEKINTQSQRLLHLIEDIIRLSEFDEVGTDKTMEFVDIYAEARRTIINLSEQAKAKEVAVNLHGDFIELTANKRMMQELLHNLIDNAIKYNNQKGSVDITIASQDSDCIITVADTGIGISDEHLPRIFERFYRAEGSRSKRTGGTGLGLAIVKHICEYHGGKATVSSDIGVGTTFTCRVPLAPNFNNK